MEPFITKFATITWKQAQVEAMTLALGRAIETTEAPYGDRAVFDLLAEWQELYNKLSEIELEMDKR